MCSYLTKAVWFTSFVDIHPLPRHISLATTLYDFFLNSINRFMIWKRLKEFLEFHGRFIAISAEVLPLPLILIALQVTGRQRGTSVLDNYLLNLLVWL